MKKVLALIVCLLFVLSVTAAFAADKAMDTKAPAAAEEKKMDERKMGLTTRNSFCDLSCVDKRQILWHQPFI